MPLRKKTRRKTRQKSFQTGQRVMRQVKLVTEKFFLNNEKRETTRKKFMEVALTARMRRTSHEIFRTTIHKLLVFCARFFEAMTLKFLVWKFLRITAPLHNFAGDLIRQSNNP